MAQVAYLQCSYGNWCFQLGIAVVWVAAFITHWHFDAKSKTTLKRKNMCFFYLKREEEWSGSLTGKRGGGEPVIEIPSTVTPFTWRRANSDRYLTPQTKPWHTYSHLSAAQDEGKEKTQLVKKYIKALILWRIIHFNAHLHVPMHDFEQSTKFKVCL